MDMIYTLVEVDLPTGRVYDLQIVSIDEYAIFSTETQAGVWTRYMPPHLRRCAYTLYTSLPVWT